VAQLPDQTRVAVIKDAAHAINYSHPVELAAIVRQFLADEPVTGPPGGAGTSPVVAFRGGRPG
jgi:hypothetical protein